MCLINMMPLEIILPDILIEISIILLLKFEHLLELKIRVYYNYLQYYKFLIILYKCMLHIT